MTGKCGGDTQGKGTERGINYTKKKKNDSLQITEYLTFSPTSL